jgi:osmotically-inducible protein OsmY
MATRKRIASAAALGFVLCLAAGTAGAAVSDRWITLKTKIALLAMEGPQAWKIDVDTTNARVTLHGKVLSEAERENAASVARTIGGAAEIRNLLQVVPEARRKRVAERDESVEGRVAAALENAPDLQDSDIDVVSVNDGVVLLGGKATTPNAHPQAVVTASGVGGVRQVWTDVEGPSDLQEGEIADLNPPMAPPHPDEAAGTLKKIEGVVKEAGTSVAGVTRDAWITTATKTALLADPDLPGLDVNVDTRDGVVTLFGIVATPAAKTQAARIAGGVAGVRSVKDALEVVPASKRQYVEIEDDATEKRVTLALERSPIEDGDLSVEVKNGVARLTGSVPSSTDRLAASYVALATAGVLAVNNDLQVRQ